jgi:folate-binding protein YgfZ
MASQIKINLAGYEAAINQAAFHHQEHGGYLHIGGEDRQAFLQRQTTNDVRVLSPERAVTTVLTSATARILDVLTLLAEPEAIGAVTLTGRAPETATFLKRRIFFTDKVSVDDGSTELAQIEVTGPEAANLLQQSGFSRIPSNGEVVSEAISGIETRLLKQQGGAYRLLLAAEKATELQTLLSEAGVSQLEDEGYAVLRVEMGWPAAGSELTEDYTPLETGLDWAISGEKGCYTGQEIIARQITYDKVTRQMVGLQLTGVSQPRDRVSSAEDGKSAGEVTSYAYSPRFEHIGLAVLRKAYSQPGTELVVESESGGIRARVVSLPFSQV